MDRFTVSSGEEALLPPHPPPAQLLAMGTLELPHHLAPLMVKPATARGTKARESQKRKPTQCLQSSLLSLSFFIIK
jgi:hypothetical protein